MVGSIASLQAHVERLFLLVLLRELPAAGGGPQAAQAAAFLAMLFSLGWAVRHAQHGRLVHGREQQRLLRLCTRQRRRAAPCAALQVRRLALALVRTFWGAGSAAAAELERELGDEAEWGMDDTVLEAAQAVAGLLG